MEYIYLGGKKIVVGIYQSRIRQRDYMLRPWLFSPSHLICKKKSLLYNNLAENYSINFINLSATNTNRDKIILFTETTTSCCVLQEHVIAYGFTYWPHIPAQCTLRACEWNYLVAQLRLLLASFGELCFHFPHKCIIWITANPELLLWYRGHGSIANGVVAVHSRRFVSIW